MATLSPFLNSNPIDLSLTLGKYVNPDRTFGRDSVLINVYVDDSLVHTTGQIRPFSLVNHDSVYVGRHRQQSKVRADITYTRLKLGVPYGFRAGLQLKPRYSRLRGTWTVAVNGSQIQSSRPYKVVRSRAQRIVKNPWVRTTRNFFPSATRPNPERITSPFLRVDESGHNGIKEIFNQSISPITKYYREWSGTRTPGFGKKKTRALPDNPHSARVTIVTENQYHWYQEQVASGSWGLTISPYSDWYTMPDSPTLFIDSAEFQSLQRLINNAQTGLQANMAQNIAQVSQIGELVFGNATKILSAYRNLRRGNISKAITTLTGGRTSPKWKGKIGNPSPSKSVASNWLQLQYGWKPLLDDIQGMMVAAGRLNSPNDFVQRASSSATAQREYRLAYPPAGPATGSAVGQTTFIVTTTCKFKIRFRVDSPLNNFLAQTGFTNPINLAWELLPLSFVADWFLPVGNYFQSMSAWDGVTFLGGSKVRFSKIRGDSTFDYHGPHGAEPTIHVDHTATSRREEIRLIRDVISSFPSSVLPSFNGAGIQAGNRAANAIALVVSTFKR